MSRIFIDIPFTEIEKAYKASIKKRNICKLIPHSRFTFDFVMDCGYGTRRVEEEDGNKIQFEQIVCEGIGGESTGTSASTCRNCIIYSCKHQTKRVKCKEKECDKEYHDKCVKCHILVDLIKARQKAFKEMSKWNQ